MPIEILMPALSPTMTEGNLAKWLKKEGDAVSSGDVIAEIETDKATMEVEAVDEGTIGKILVAEGSEGVQVNEVIALLLEEGEDKKAIDAWKPKKVEKPKEEAADDSAAIDDDAPKVAAGPAPAAALAPQATKAPDAPVKKVGKAAAAGEVKASPLAKRMAADKALDLSRVSGTGPHGRVIQADVEEALLRGVGGGGAVKRHPVEMVQVPNSMMRKTVAKRLTESKQQTPHFYLTVECEIDDLLKTRGQINAAATADENGKPAYKVSVNDMIIKAVACSLRDKPECNASWYDDAIIQYNNVDVSVAVAIDGGLITPIVKNADQKSLPQISKEMKSLAGRARSGDLKPEEYQGGGFSISNLGMFGVQEFAAIVNPPQACILAVGAGEEKVVRRNGEFAVVNVMKVTLSTDHRAVDGALGAEFLQLFKNYIQNPILMFM
ncbi:MAG: pyruvate dehydrogenase complex dihydrolipoamide acetyltransferase [Rickettsiales bacterium]|nr:pyruvate dehydrogenase complex dihydrolipoamide acetyltransferase [Rickettsiales bacterium]